MQASKSCVSGMCSFMRSDKDGEEEKRSMYEVLPASQTGFRGYYQNVFLLVELTLVTRLSADPTTTGAEELFPRGLPGSDTTPRPKLSPPAKLRVIRRVYIDDMISHSSNVKNHFNFATLLISVINFTITK